MAVLIPVLFGSQTGNGVFLAKELSKAIERIKKEHKITSYTHENSFKCLVMSIDEFDLSTINSFDFVIFICSTHGDGQPPFNMAKFYNLILSTQARIFTFKSAVLGLGDSSYQKYNHCARMLVERLKQLGSNVVHTDLCNSQDEGGMYDGYNRFKNEIIEYLQDSFINVNERIEKKAYQLPSVEYKAVILYNKPMTAPGYEERVNEISLSISELPNFTPGDCLIIKPRNTVDLNLYFSFDKEQMEYLAENIDFYSVPQQPTFVELEAFATSLQHKEKLLEISRDYELYHSYVITPRRNILEVIEDFSLQVDYEFLRNYNTIMPRFYTFAMLSDKERPEVRVLYNVIEYSTYLQRKRVGLCSSYLSRLEQGQSIRVGVVKSSLFVKDTKLLVFATGTGFTLPRAMLHDMREKRIVVFYGFRHYNKDQLCKEETEEMLKKNEDRRIEIYYASSRDDKKYVMDVYREHPVEDIESWLVFVSGNSRLNKEIRGLLREVHGKEVAIQSETW